MESYTGKLYVVIAAFWYLTLRLDSAIQLHFIRFAFYRDLKPHNLLMDRKTMLLKIADLGLARAYTVPIKKYTHEVLSCLFTNPFAACEIAIY